MIGRIAQFLKDRRGNSAVEFGLFLPFMLMLLGGFVELGRAYVQAEAIEKGLRSGVLFSARSADPDSPTVLSQAFNLVRTGTLDGSGALLAANWTAPEAQLTASFTSALVGTTAVPVIRFTAQVPFQPIVPGLAKLARLDAFTITLSHEQAYVGQ